MNCNTRIIILYLWTVLAMPLHRVEADPVHRKPEGRIVGGQVARAGQFPFVAAIMVENTDTTVFCGGTILTQKYILTAGNCIEGAYSFTIQVGSNTLSGDDEHRYTTETSHYLLHPDYNRETLEYNLGFVILVTDLKMASGYIWPIYYLPINDVGPSEQVLAIGWGQLGDERPGLTNALNFVDLKTLSNVECRTTYGDQITEDMICVIGTYDQGTCYGDMGGPLLQDADVGMIQVGIGSFISGGGCESRRHPSGFTRIYPHLDWIRNTTERN